jgi:hypothetical protein
MVVVARVMQCIESTEIKYTSDERVVVLSLYCNDGEVVVEAAMGG